MQSVDPLLGSGELAAQTKQPPVVLVLLHQMVVTEGRTIEILAEVDARQTGKTVFLGETAHPQAVCAVAVADLAQALAQVGKLPHPHGIGRGHAGKPQNGLAGGGLFAAGGTLQVPFLAIGIIGHIPVGKFVQVKARVDLAAWVTQPECRRTSIHPDQCGALLLLGFLTMGTHIQGMDTVMSIFDVQGIGLLSFDIRPQIEMASGTC